MPGFLDERLRIQRASEILRAVAHPERLRIVAQLCLGPCHVNGLVETLELAQPIVSQHLRVLRLSRLVSPTRRKGHAYYEIIEPRLFELVELLLGEE